MSVETDADKCLDLAKDGISSSIRSITRIIIEDAWGHEDFTAEFKNRLRRAAKLLLDVQELLN